MWGFLGEFWDNIASTTINAWEYTEGWFQNIGYAVAGAIGGLFDWVLHYVNDFFIFLGWILNGIKELFFALLKPLDYALNFLQGFWGSATADPINVANDLNASSSVASTLLAQIPYWTTISTVLGVCILIIGGIGIIHQFTKL